MSDLDPRNTGYMTIYQIEDLIGLYLYIRLLVPVGLKLYRL